MPAKVLIIDDEQVIRDGCVRVLEKEGLDVCTVPNGEKGLELMRKRPADVVLLDLMMPGIDGFEVLARIREKWPGCRVIIITGFATVEKAVQAMKNGAFDFLPKPFEPDYLRIVIRRATDQISLERETARLREEKEMGLRTIMTEQSRLRTIINCMESAVLVVDKDLTVLLHNPTLVRLLEVQTDPMVGKQLSESVRNADLCTMVSDVTSQGRTISREFPENTIGKCFFRAQCAPVRGGDDEILGSVTVFEDLSALKKVDQLKSDFVAMVSHELRAPLASVEQMAYVLRDGLAGDINAKGQNLVERMLVRTRELLQLIKNLLDLSRIEMGVPIQNMESIGIRALVEEVIEMIRPQAEKRGQTISLESSKKIPTIVGDRDNLLGVFGNIIGNAVKYTPEGGKIDVRASHDGNFVRVDVRDTGVGIPKEDLARIFDKFYRVKGKTRGITGSGLGLSVTKSIIEAHHGEIRVESEENTGTTFKVFLPVPVQPAPPD